MGERLTFDKSRKMKASLEMTRCDRRYLAFCFGTQFVLLACLLIVDLVFWDTIGIAVVACILMLFAFLKWAIQKSWKFTITADQVRTEKLFTGHIDLRTPLDQVVGINEYEGILEALFDVGTIEISTASSQRDHVAIKWPHLRNARKVASRIEALLKEKRSSNH